MTNRTSSCPHRDENWTDALAGRMLAASCDRRLASPGLRIAEGSESEDLRVLTFASAARCSRPTDWQRQLSAA